MNIKDLWIGDKVSIRGEQKNVFFEGLIDGDFALVRYKNKRFKVPIRDIGEPIAEKTLNALEPTTLESTNSEFTAVPDAIDLHYAQLFPNDKNPIPVRILDRQLEACETYIHQAFKQGKTQVTVIHGKGEGVLKRAVLELLKGLTEVQFFVELAHGGAQEVWLKQHP